MSKTYEEVIGAPYRISSGPEHQIELQKSFSYRTKLQDIKNAVG